MADDQREELAHLVRGFAGHLRRAARQGQQWVGSAPSPRLGAGAGEEAIEPSPGGGDPAPQAAPTLEGVREELGDCQRCRLHDGRRNLVFGVGSPQADLMFVGEAPGRDEDSKGEPFVGMAGQLLTRMIEAMGLTRGDVYITNILKCRPPNNRNPERDEVDTCEPFLRQQIDAIAPRIIIALGNFAAKTLLRTDIGITRLRGSLHSYQGIPLMPTFHPAYLLRNPEGKRPAWNDLQTVMAEMDRLGLYRRRDGARG